MAPPLQIGRYVLHGEIASGGMASVHYGRLLGASGFTKTVAIKRLHRALTRVESFKNMILEEGRLAARVRHPNVVPPLDVLAESGELLLVMEYVHGESLSRLLRAAWANGERVPLPIAAAILSNVLHGLHAAHEAKDEAGNRLDIVHRDISPQNVIVGVDGVARVIDFGIAKAVTSEGMTTAGTIKGKVPYLAPEQLEGDPATRRTDIYAASVVFWELLANRRLFQGEDDSEILRQIISKPVDPPSAFNPLVAGTVDDVVLRGLARNPSERFATAREMALELEAAVHLATTTVVGAWTERLAAVTLAERAERIREVEAAPAPSQQEAPAPAPGTVRLPPTPTSPMPFGASGAAPSSSRAVPSRPGAAPPSVRAGAPSPAGTAPPSGRAGVPSRPGGPPSSRAGASSRPGPPSLPSSRPGPPSLPSSRPPLPSPAEDIPTPPAADAPRLSIPLPPAPGSPRLSIPMTSGPGATMAMPAPPPGRAPSAQPQRATRPPPPVGERVSVPPVRPPSASQQTIEPRTVIYEPPPMPEPVFVEGVRPIGRDGPPPPLPPPASIPQGPSPPPAAGTLRKPDLAIRNVDWLPAGQEPPAEKGSAFRRFLRYLAAFLVLSAIVAWMFAPALARAWIVTGAASRGMVVSIDRVDVSRREIRLNDVHVESTEFPGAVLRAGTVVIGLRWLVPESVTIDDAELALDGSYSDIESRLVQYRARRAPTFAELSGGIRSIEVTSGRIDWKNLMGSETSALVENITFEVTKNPIRKLGDDYRLSAPLFTMKLAGAPAGPWQLDVDRQGILLRTVVRFDPSGTYPASITRTTGDDGSVSLSLAIPPTALGDLHLPPSMVGKLLTERTRIEARGEVQIVAVQTTTTRGADSGVAEAGASASDAGARADGGPAVTASASPNANTPAIARSMSGHLALGLGAVAVFPGAPPVDVLIDVPMAGDPARTLPLAAVLTVSQADPLGGAIPPAGTAPMTGSLELSRGAGRIDLAGRTGAIACAGRAAAGPGQVPAAPAPKVKAGESSGVIAALGVTLDDYASAKVTFLPVGTCTPRLR